MMMGTITQGSGMANMCSTSILLVIYLLRDDW